MTHFVRLAARLGLSALALLIYSAPAAAQYYEGYTNGCFNEEGESACTPVNTSPSDPVSVDGLFGDVLTFSGDSFYEAAIEGSTTLDLGTFSLGNALLGGIFDTEFQLRTTFVNPTGAEGLFTADLWGGIFITEGYAQIDFGDTPFYFGPNNRYALTVDDLYLGKGLIDKHFFDNPRSAMLTGTITNTSVTPEPVSMALLGTGLAGLGAARRRRKNAGDSDA